VIATIAKSAKVSLIVPTYRERENIAPLLAAICPVLSDWDYEVIFVDDGSTDGTAEAIQEAMSRNPRIRLIVRRGERGLAGAVVRGFAEATGSILGSINADLSHDASILPNLIGAIEGGAELAVGSRRIPGGGFSRWPWYRRLASDIATAMTTRVLRVPLSDPMSGFYFLRRSAFERSRSELKGHGFKLMLEFAVIGRPFPITEVPYVFKNRERGSSKMSPKVAVQFLRMLWQLGSLTRSRRRRPLSDRMPVAQSRETRSS
jgi:dolichol-phosphate mannosyltransferase